MHAFDGENEVNRRKAEAKAAGDAYMQLAGFNRPRRRFFLGAWLSAIGRRLRASQGDVQSLNLPSRKADQPSQ